jgi:autotransporter-associated beta strand protein
VTLQSSGLNQEWRIDGASKTTSILDLEGVIKNATANTSFLTDATVNVKSGGQLIAGTSIVTGTTATGSGSILNIAGTVEIASTGSSLILNNTGAITADSSITLSSGGNITFTNVDNTNGIRFGPATGSSNPLTQLTGTLNLNGGIATLNKIFVGGGYSGGAIYNSYVNLNGGTLTALRDQVDFMEGLTSANVKAGGAIFDTNGKNITVSQALIADSTSGGLEKKGSGTLTLDATSTYTGDTLVNSGTLTLASAGGLKFVIGADDVNNKITGAGTVNLDGLFTFDLTAASTTINDSWNIVDVANLFESFGSTFSVGTFNRAGGGTGPGIWTKAIGPSSSYEFNTGTGVLTVIPEPNVAAMLGGLGMFCLLRRRRA